MAGIKWTTEEDEFLVANYGNLSKEQLLSHFPGRTWDAIKLHANYRGLQYYVGVHEHVQADLSRLLQDTPQAFYWMGFLAADGYFSQKHLKLTLAKKDKRHVIQFARFIQCRNHRVCRNGYEVKVQDGFTIPKIIEKFKLKKVKTYNPPDIGWMTEMLFVAFCIGFIDGDGSIKFQSGRKDCLLQIKTHASWLDNLQLMSNRLSRLAGVKPVRAKVNNAGYASVCFGNCVLLRHLKRKTREMELPVLRRKWDRIDETHRSRYEVAKENRANVLELSKLGMRNRDMAQKLHLSPSCISVIMRELKENMV